MDKLKALIADLVEAVKVPLRNLMDKEPARVTAAVSAAIIAAAAFAADKLGVVIPENLMPWVILVVGGAIVEMIRKVVFSSATVQAIADVATYQPAGTHIDIGKPPEGN
jgi:hypothetical protein